MKKIKLAILAAVIMVFCLPATCFAAEYYLEDGDISIYTDGTTQTVKQQEHVIEDLNPVIHNRTPEKATHRTIEISTEKGAVANVTIKDVNIMLLKDAVKSGIDVKGDSKVLLIVEGENFVETQNGKAAVHVADGALGITGNGTLNAKTLGVCYDAVEDLSAEAAAIGTNKEEDLNGSITIGGNARVNAEVNWGEEAYDENESAAIGTGYAGNIAKDASISIIDHAVVDAKTDDDGSGIGTGADGNIDGTIIIKDEADVTGYSSLDGSGIGVGESGTLGKDALIWITGKAKVYGISDDDGAGIGVGRIGEFHGKILIDGESNVTAFVDSEGAGIGSGEEADASRTAQIIIGGSAKVVARGLNYSTGIGSGEDAAFGGDIIIQDEADVSSYGASSAAAIGADSPGGMTGSIQILGNSKVITGYTDGNDIITDPVNPGMIGGGGHIECGDIGNPEMTLVIGQGATINGILANSAENVANILAVYTDGVTSDSDNFSQVENPADLKTFEPKLDQAKLPVYEPKQEEETEKPVVPAEPAEPAVPDQGNADTNAANPNDAYEPVPTGDQADITLWFTMIVFAFAGILGTKKVYNRQKNKRNI